MKKTPTILLIIFSAFMVLRSSAQDNDVLRDEIRICYGILPASQVSVSFFDALFLPSAKTDKYDSLITNTNSQYGVISVQYGHQFGKVVHLGAALTFNPVATKYLYKKGGMENDTWLCFSFMPRLDFCYFNRNIFTIYSSVAAGVSFLYCHADYNNRPDETFNTFWWAYQFTAMGIRIGKDIGGFVEIGYGYQGVINLGLSAKL